MRNSQAPDEDTEHGGEGGAASDGPLGHKHSGIIEEEGKAKKAHAPRGAHGDALVHTALGPTDTKDKKQGERAGTAWDMGSQAKRLVNK